ncbi:hypothetical protein GCM10012275_54890 [Longimycelium tulufanense]|uniref:Uncharacterized protein n=1 Tax=Longimycelium tulufanense TaxID=907463 RepID=A0A8J3FWH7_9PSEU|nr:hypothetical protein [Longimycelium tulufanense]GGM77265.1 hypothetical protein GCM10012275_54890 [Longimycelium tulufanense]
MEDDTTNDLLCKTCGWTVNMVCPECPKGCGCETRCTGWRHHEYVNEDDLVDGNVCDECGASDGYGCNC